jgi:amidase
MSDPHEKSEELAYASLATLRHALDAGETSSAELTQSLIARIDAIDGTGPALHSILAVAPDAIESAKARDRERLSGETRSYLHGIPIVIKDNLDTAGLASSAGSLALSRPPATDAAVVASLHAAGMVILGKTNLSEWANFRSEKSSSGWSAMGGQTHNPFALERSPSGSSSGSAVAVAAGLSPIAIATETDGSILSPSAVCGIVGIKPTVGLVSRRGIIPIAESQDTAGPMARSVADAAALLAIIAASGGGDTAHPSRPDGPVTDYLSSCRHDGLEGKRIGVPRDGFSGYHPRADQCFAAALEAMKEAGATIIDPVTVPGAAPLRTAEDELTVLLYEFHDGLDRYLSARAEATGSGPRSLDNVIAFNLEYADAELVFFGQDLLERAARTGSLADPEYKEARARCVEESRAQGIDFALDSAHLDALAVLTTGPAWLIDHVNGDSYLGAGYSIAAVAGYPSITVPIGAVSGLPVGLALLGRAWSEAVLIEAASGLEAALGVELRPGFSRLTPIV